MADPRPPTPDSKGLISVPGTKGTAWGTELMVSHQCCLVTDSNYACGEHGITVVVESLGCTPETEVTLRVNSTQNKQQQKTQRT